MVICYISAADILYFLAFIMNNKHQEKSVPGKCAQNQYFVEVFVHSSTKRSYIVKVFLDGSTKRSYSVHAYMDLIQ